MSKKEIIIYEFLGFICLVIFVRLNEILDIPHTLFYIAKTPINITESIIESIIVIVVAIATVYVSSKLLKKIKHLASLLQICCECKKIHDSEINDWIRMEVYFDEHSIIRFSHGFCPECAEKFVNEQ